MEVPLKSPNRMLGVTIAKHPEEPHFHSRNPSRKKESELGLFKKSEGFVNLLSVTQGNLMKSQIIDDSPLKSVEHLFPREVHNSLPASSHNQFRLHKDTNAMLVS